MLENLKNSELDILPSLDNPKNVCRFCFDELGKSRDTFSIFHKNIWDIFIVCCGNISLKEDGRLPDCICETCHSTLRNTFKFLSLVNSSERILKDYLRNHNLAKNLNDQKESTASDGDTNNGKKREVVDFDDESDNADKTFLQLSDIRKRDDSRKAEGKKKKRTEGINFKCYNCPSCNKKYKSNFDLEVHVRTHSGERPFTCSSCGKTFIDSRNLRRHEKIHTGHKKHECSVCHRKFLHLFSLKIHERIHKGEKPYICDMCGKSFNTCGELKIHGRVHTKDRPYACNLCGKAFSSKASLNIHTRIHTGDRRHCCKLCDRKCRTAYDLKVHMRCHNNDKPYVCKYANCERRYKNSSQLNVHLRTHTGEKSHQCSICLKRFGESNTLKRHKSIHQMDRNKASC